jgi:hypothetical protein
MVKVLDPLPALRAREAKAELMYFQNDERLTPAGQAVIAESVLRNLSLGSSRSWLLGVPRM